jgi:hypothetical protein
MKRLLLSLLAIALLVLVAAGPTSAAAPDDATTTTPTGEAGPAGLISGEFDAFAVRVEYDIPLPAGTGTIPRVVGEVRRSGAGENAKGLAASPTQLDAVVGGTYVDPSKDQKGDERRPPQVECFYPGDLLNTRFDFPTDTQAETAAAPPVGYAIARCGAGPEVDLAARNGAAELPGVRVGGGVADGRSRPSTGTLGSEASARATDVVLADGAITIGSIDVHGTSATKGTPGTATTASEVRLGDVTVAGVRFSVANGRISVAGSNVPLDAASTATFVKTLNTTLAPTGCRLDLLSRPETYPQGFLLGRKPPAMGVAEDGSLAASMQGGLLVLCDLPKDATAPTGFSPQRMQVLVGFAYTSVAAADEPGGFAGFAEFGSGGAFGDTTADLGETFSGSPAAVVSGALAPTAALDVAPEAAADVPLEPAPTPDATAAPPPTAHRARPVLAAVSFAMDPAHRALLALVCLALWAALTHVGLRRLRGVTEG